MLAEMEEKVEANAAVRMMYFFCRSEKVEYCSCFPSSGVSSSDAGRTSVRVCFVDPFVSVDMMRLAKGWSQIPFVANKQSTWSGVSGKMLLRLAIYYKIRALHVQSKAAWRRPRLHEEMSPDPTPRPMLTCRSLLDADESLVNGSVIGERLPGIMTRSGVRYSHSTQ